MGVSGEKDLSIAAASDLSELYRAMGRWTVDLAMCKGTIDAAAAQRLLDVLAARR